MDNRRRLYHARISRHLTLEQIGIRTALSPTVLRNIDEGRFELLPSGVYARSYVRTYASAVGLNPDEALAELEDLLPGAPDPIALLHEARAVTPWERAGRRLAQWPGWQELRRAGQWLRWPPVPRVELWPAAGTRQRVAAAAIDATVLTVVGAFLVMLVSWSSGIRLSILLQEAGLAVAALSAIPVALYFLLFGGIAGSTLGQYACRLIDQKHDHPLTLPDILRRAVRR
jgi:hypothetical protein